MDKHPNIQLIESFFSSFAQGDIPGIGSVLVHAVHAAAVAAACRRCLGLRNLDGDQGFGGQQQACDRGCVLQRRAGDLGRIDDAGLDQVFELRP
jgi:hypothetical protein